MSQPLVLASVSNTSGWTIERSNSGTDFSFKIKIPDTDITVDGTTVTDASQLIGSFINNSGSGFTSDGKGKFTADFILSDSEFTDRQFTLAYDDGAGGVASLEVLLSYSAPLELTSASGNSVWTITPTSASAFTLTIPQSDILTNGVDSISDAHALSIPTGMGISSYDITLAYTSPNFSGSLILADPGTRTNMIITLSWNGITGSFTFTVPPWNNSGNGGNNGGNGHNKMSAELKFQCLFEAGATGSYDITVLGEGAQAVTVDETIVMNVPMSDMRKLLVFESNWAEYVLGSTGFSATDDGSQPAPKVQLQLDHIIGTALNNLSCALTGAGPGYQTAEKKIADDSASSRNSLPHYFTANSADFLFSGVAGGALMSIPQEAIKSIDNKGIVGSLLKDVFSHHSTDEADAYTPALLNLFEQAVAASKVTVGTTGETGPNADNAPLALVEADVTGAAVGWTNVADSRPAFGVHFQPDDTLSMYVRYSMVKERTYKVDADITAGAFTGVSGSTGSTLALSYGGVTFSVAADGSETSDPITKVYEIKLKCTDATPSQWA